MKLSVYYCSENNEKRENPEKKKRLTSSVVTLLIFRLFFFFSSRAFENNPRATSLKSKALTKCEIGYRKLTLTVKITALFVVEFVDTDTKSNTWLFNQHVPRCALNLKLFLRIVLTLNTIVAVGTTYNSLISIIIERNIYFRSPFLFLAPQW